MVNSAVRLLEDPNYATFIVQVNRWVRACSEVQRAEIVKETAEVWR